MKKILLSLTALLLGLCTLSGCGQNKKTLFLPEAEGDRLFTVVYGGKESGAVEPVRLIHADGTLYYDSGLIAEEDVLRCGTLSGTLKKTVEEYEVPKKDGEANFRPDTGKFGYQNTTGITKEIPIDGTWAVFRKLEEYGSDLSRYAYGFRLRGRHPGADADSEYIILADTLDVTFEQVTDYLFSSQIPARQEDMVIIYPMVTDPWGIRLWAENSTPQGLEISCEQFGGSAAGKLQTGEAYTLEVFRDEAWIPVETKTPDTPPVWHAVAYDIPENEITKWNIDFTRIYDVLPPGLYRVGKTVMDFREAGAFEEKTYYAEFQISDE